MANRTLPVSQIAVSRLPASVRECAHCNVRVLSEGRHFIVALNRIETWSCNSCFVDTVFISPLLPAAKRSLDDASHLTLGEARQIIPSPSSKAKAFPNAPSDVISAYRVSVELEPVYAPAAAAMARKAIELLLEHSGYSQRTLSEKILALSKETDPDRRVSSRLVGLLGALREFGNIGLHPIRSVSTTEILEVEPAEVAMCIATAEELMEEICERPAKERSVLTPIVEKLRDAGKVKAAEALEATLAPSPSPSPVPE